MNVIDGLDVYEAPAAGTVISIGNFDGVHLGHRLILRTARQLADDLGVPQVVVTFEPHPLAIIRPEHSPGRLTTHSERLALIADNGADATIVIRSTPEFFALTADEFAALLCERCRPRLVVEGPTFNYGKDRAGSVDTLRAHGWRHGFEVGVVERVLAEELPGRPEVNSSTVRRALSEGRVADAAVMLGRPHRLAGRIGRGYGRGTGLGVPTANLDHVPQLLPANAVYAGVAQIDDGRAFPSAVNIGGQPTFAEQQPAVEAHLIDFAGDVRGRRVGVYLLERLRPQREFNGAAELAEQIGRDIDAVRRAAAVEELLRAMPALPL